jgi:hypothetical protein
MNIVHIKLISSIIVKDCKTPDFSTSAIRRFGKTKNTGANLVNFETEKWQILKVI